MSTDENVERARSDWLGDTDLVDMLERGPEAVSEIFPALDPDVRVEFIAQDLEVTQSYEGVEGLYEGWRDWLDPWSSYVIRMDELVEAGPSEFVVMGRAEARTSRDSVLMEHRPGAIIQFDDEGRVTSIRFFLEADDALKAAGVERS